MATTATPPTHAARRTVVARLVSPATVVLGGLCMMYLITYMDRVNIATAAPFMRRDLGLSETEMGLVFSAFAIPYGLLQPFGGWLGDRFGPRVVLGVVGALWAVSTALTGLANGLAVLFISRLMLGFGEGATFPTATKAMATWLPPWRRAFAQGVTHSFARIGNAITPPIVGAIILTHSWRASFVLLGVLSLIWVVWWVWFFRDDPHANPKMTDDELADLPPQQVAGARPHIPWGPLIRKILPVTLVDFCYGWTLWVYLTWLPSFLANSYGLSIKKFVWFSAGILLAGVVGDTVGGVVSDQILVRTGNIKVARRANLVVGLAGSFAFLVPCLFIHNLAVVTVCLSLAFFFLELTNAVLWALPMDLAPRYAGTAGGLMNTGFGIAGILSPAVFGYLVDRTGSWQLPFWASVVLLGLGVLLSLRIDPTKPLEEPSVAR